MTMIRPAASVCEVFLSVYQQLGVNNVYLYLSFELVVDVHEDESGDLDQCDDEGSFSDGAQMIPDQPQD